MTIPLQSSVVYGPIRSRRLGVSLGINLLPTEVKFCLSNCIYCQYGWTDLQAMRKVKLHPARELLEEIERDFSLRASQGLRVDAITFSGNGEPTLHPELETLIHGVKKLRNQYFPKARLGILSDSTRVHLPEVRKALSELDERYMKLDAGDPETYARVNNPVVKVDWNSMIAGLRGLPDTTLQSLFIRAPVDNSTGAPFERWLKAVAEIKPKAVHVYTLDRPTADPKVKPVPRERLVQIGELIRECCAVAADVFTEARSFKKGGSDGKRKKG